MLGPIISENDPPFFAPWVTLALQSCKKSEALIHKKKFLKLVNTVNVLKFPTLLFLDTNKMSVIWAGIPKMVQQQSDLGLQCLSRPFCMQLVFENFEWLQ